MKSIQRSTRQWARPSWQECPPGASNNRRRAKICNKCSKRPLCWTWLDCKQPLRTWPTLARSWFHPHHNCRLEMGQLCSRGRSCTCIQKMTSQVGIMGAMTRDSPMKRSVTETRRARSKILLKSLIPKIPNYRIHPASLWTILQRAQIWTSWVTVIYLQEVKSTQITLVMKRKSWRLRPLSRYEVVQVAIGTFHGKSAVR